MPMAGQGAGGRPRWRPALAWVLPLALLLAVLALCGIRYHTNDDATLANIAAGAYGPDRVHLVYVNILFGWLLRPLYMLAGGWNWYVLVQLGLMVAACAALYWLAMERFGTRDGTALFLAVALPFLTSMFYMFHYVKVSGLCLAAGLAWLAARLGQPLRRCWPGILLALLGSLLRWDMFIAVGGLSAALLLGRLLALDGAGKRRALAAMAVLFALVSGAKAVDAAAYRLDEGWDAFARYNAARMEFSDYKVYSLGEENPFRGQGVADIDYAMLRSWDFYDGSVFPTQRVAALAAQVPGRGLWDAARETVKSGLGLLHGSASHILFGLALLACLLWLRWDTHSLPFFGTLALFGAELFYLMLRQRFPSYVEQPLLAACMVFLVVGAAGGRPRAARPRRARHLALALALALAAVLAAPELYSTWAGSDGYREWAALEEPYFAAMEADKEHLYLLATEALTVGEGLDVWHPRTPGHYSNILYYGGWLSHAPHREAVLAAYGLADPLTGAVDNARVYLDYHGIEAAAQYASEHLGRPVRAVKTGANDFAPYQLVSGAG